MHVLASFKNSFKTQLCLPLGLVLLLGVVLLVVVVVQGAVNQSHPHCCGQGTTPYYLG